MSSSIPTRWMWLMALGVLAAACSDVADQAESTTTSLPAVTTSAAATTTTEAPSCPDAFCLVYHIRADATWSDGAPIVAADFAHTLDIYTDPLTRGVEGTGYALVTDGEVIDDKTLLVAFSEPFAAWRTLFEVVYPAHATHGLAGAPSSGPFVVREWVEGDRIVLDRNGMHQSPFGPPGEVTELWFLFAPGVRDLVEGVEDGRFDLVNPRPLDWMVGELSAAPTVRLELAPGPFWEHIDFNHDDPLLSQLWVRQAIALAIDRQAILDSSVRLIDPNAAVLDSTIWTLGSVHYGSSYQTPHDPVAAEQILIDNFCGKQSDGIYSCQGKRLTFRWATTVGDELREAQVALAAGQLEAVGIEIVPVLMTPSELFSTEVFFGGPEAWQIMSFSWKAGADPYTSHDIYQCRGSAPSGFGALNVNRFCDDRVEGLIGAAFSELDPTQRAGLYSEADQIYLEQLAMIPLFQKPALLAWQTSIQGPRANPWMGDLWNVATWTGKQTVVVGLGSEPSALAPLVPIDDVEAMVRSVLYQGAFAVGPDREFVPALVEEVQMLLGQG